MGQQKYFLFWINLKSPHQKYFRKRGFLMHNILPVGERYSLIIFGGLRGYTLEAYTPYNIPPYPSVGMHGERNKSLFIFFKFLLSIKYVIAKCVVSNTQFHLYSDVLILLFSLIFSSICGCAFLLSSLSEIFLPREAVLTTK